MLNHLKQLFLHPLFVLFSVVLLCCFTTEDGNQFNIVIKQVSEQKPALLKRLKTFQNNGIEKVIDQPNFLSSDSLISIAKEYLNTPHCMGGTTKKCIDCSGLVWATYHHFGINLPHSSHEQARYGAIIAEQDSLKRGDLLFFEGTYSTNKLITHAGFYLGDGKFIHTSAKKGVEIISFTNSNYWQQHYLLATRIVNKP